MRFTPRSTSSSTSTPASWRRTRQDFTAGTNSGDRSEAAMSSNTFDGGAAITISRVTLEAMRSSFAASGFQRLAGAEARQQRSRQPPDAAFQVEAGVHGVAGGEQLRLAQHPVLE